MNERLLRDTCEARLRLLGHPGPSWSPSVEPSVRFAEHPSPRTWYLAHNVTIVSAYLDHRDLAEHENRVERFFINLVLIRVLYAHALVASPRLALAWLAPIARWLGDPRLDMTGMFLSVSRVLPSHYPLEGELDDYIANEHTIGRLLDVGIITPRLTELYHWAADELRIPDVTDLVTNTTPTYAWSPDDRKPWTPPPTRLVRVVRRTIPPPRRPISDRDTVGDMTDDPYAGWALIVVDAQQGFDDPSWGARNNPACDANIAALVDDWTSHDRPLVYVRHDGTEEGSPLAPGTPGNGLRDYLGTAEPHLVVSKQVNSAFHGSPDLHAWLLGQQTAGIVVCGITTNHCCETTVRVGANLGHDVLFPIDATFCHDRRHPDGITLSADELTRATAASLHDEFANVTTTEEILAGRARPID